MRHTESEYIDLGVRYERAPLNRARSIGKLIKIILEGETPNDRELAKELIERGRKDARN